MPKAGRYHEGVPCWVELAAPDVERARRFYGGLFGWEYVATGPVGDEYLVATVRGVQVAGIRSRRAVDGQGPPAWTTYLAVDDADRMAGLVQEAGGLVVFEPFEVPDQGRGVLAVDPLGAVFGLWQGSLNPGAGLVNEPGTVAWNDQLSPDPDTARDFYRRVFDYGYDAAAADHTVFRVRGLPVGGIGGDPGIDPDGPPAFWAVYFGAADTDRAVERAVRLGASVLDGPEPTPFGRLAVVRDDGGAVFTLISVPPGEPVTPAAPDEPGDRGAGDPGEPAGPATAA
ncbi:VOC family protein [Kitasatospora sp. NPDC050463]|uniref:VOC family protein n=1 Tax=Kitasatospora sp. NPDC050463 TaxID=3155786 RepID=UPI0033E8DD05